jgi:hypothetical protein
LKSTVWTCQFSDLAKTNRCRLPEQDLSPPPILRDCLPDGYPANFASGSMDEMDLRTIEP